MFRIGKRVISPNEPPYLIAELSANHNGSIDIAKKSIKAAKSSGADAIKIQSYEPDTITIDSDKQDFIIEGGLWDGYKLFDLYSEAQTPFKWHKELFEYARKENIEIFSTPFDETAVDLLISLDVPAFKVASFEIVDIPLIQYIAKFKKPILLSTGMASLDEISEALEAAKISGAKDILLFHCISNYPASFEEVNLSQIDFLRKTFNVQVGLSDHTLGNEAAVLSVALGVSAIEKHFILDKSIDAPDKEFSMDPEQLKDLVFQTRNAHQALGDSTFSRSESESNNKIFRRSIYFIKNLKKGEIVSQSNIKRIRPGFGISPKFYSEIIGKRLLKDVERGDPVSWDCLEK